MEPKYGSMYIKNVFQTELQFPGTSIKLHICLGMKLKLNLAVQLPNGEEQLPWTCGWMIKKNKKQFLFMYDYSSYYWVECYMTTL